MKVTLDANCYGCGHAIAPGCGAVALPPCPRCGFRLPARYQQAAQRIIDYINRILKPAEDRSADELAQARVGAGLDLMDAAGLLSIRLSLLEAIEAGHRRPTRDLCAAMNRIYSLGAYAEPNPQTRRTS